ncbi:J domain-containing protein [Synechococcus sp. 7002]|uniref:J domain-containing protein n=1 Tax=Synechococcus sp. 7002 TaxID=1938862 RepID=UPI000A2AE98D|nr:J domain-containing protein [Synechococcus sp. 7002]SMQ78384.1 DnaJ domain-containing protein [Synechococcus sp. 7002]
MSLAINQGLFARKIADHFAVLGLPIDANPKVVRKAYLQIAQRLHPDTCTLTQALDKRLASEFLSKLVNPAYEKLSKPASWSEYQVILVQLSQQLSNETDNLVLTTTEAQELLDTPGNISALYREKVAALAQANYQTMATVPQAIATLSELNLVYLQYLGKVKKVETKETMPQYPGETMATSGATVSPPPKNTSTSSLDAALWRGEEHLKRKTMPRPYWNSEMPSSSIPTALRPTPSWDCPISAKTNWQWPRCISKKLTSPNQQIPSCAKPNKPSKK